MTLGSSLMHRICIWRMPLIVLGALVRFAGGEASAATAGDTVDFNRDVRRILSENCFKCHGPDSKARSNGKKVMRLDLPESARAELGNGHHAIVPGHPEQSELIRRVTTTDLDDKMPPPDSGKKLTAPEITLLNKWIKEGAAYSRHWAYVKPERAALPKVRNTAWPRNAIDHFILARLEREKLKPTPEADRPALIRRVMTAKRLKPASFRLFPTASFPPPCSCASA